MQRQPLRRGLGRVWRRFHIATFACLLAPFSAPIAHPVLAQTQVQGAAAASLGAHGALPPLERAERRFMAQRGWRAGHSFQRRTGGSAGAQAAPMLRLHPEGGSSTNWTALGPQAITTATFGLVSGRVTALAINPADATGNHLVVGTTGGGLWQTNVSQSTTTVPFTPMTDNIPVLASATDAGVSVGAVSFQPGATGVLLAGLGDPNDALDSYYGAGLLRSTDSGNTWSLITQTSDLESGLAGKDVSFAGEGFAGFAWSGSNPLLVVAAVSHSYESALVNGLENSPASYTGLFYSSDSGATWHMATVTDPNGQIIQGPANALSPPDGNPATAVAWNPIRHLFLAAIRYHGYYQSSDGVNWTRLTTQPGAGLTSVNCPSQSGFPGATGCPIFRGALAVNPQTGDTFAWTVDVNLQDQGIWQDACTLSGGICSTVAFTFPTQINTAALETSSTGGNATILSGDYNLTLAAVPSNQDTLLFAGGVDLFRCSLANSCQWRNTTNATTCASAGVGAYQHAFAWNPANPLLVFVGNDSGLWRSIDAVAETGSVCNSTDATHFANLNAGLGPLAEVVALDQNATNPLTMLTGVAGTGTVGVMNAATPPEDWSQLLSGEGGSVVVDPTSTINNWYANVEAGVAIYHCDSAALCLGSAWGATPTVGENQVNSDGLAMNYPAAFVQDALDPTQLLVATCRIWRGEGDGANWTAASALSGPLDGLPDSACVSNALIRSLAARANGNGTETLYVGMAGSADGGGSVPGHLFTTVFNPTTGAISGWTDLALSPATNSPFGFNPYGYDVAGVTIDAHDTTGNTVYAAIEGFSSGPQGSPQLYRSIDGGQHWAAIASNLPAAPANAVVVDPQDANTVYVGMDTGVYLTHQITSCATGSCFAVYGSGLPLSPVTQLVATPLGATTPTLTAATYGRGIWQIPLSVTASSVATATLAPSSLSFASTSVGATSAGQSILVSNTGSAALTVSSLSLTGTDPGDFSETDSCTGQTVGAGSTCSITVTFAPSQQGTRTATLTLFANVAGGQLQAQLTGTAVAPAAITLQPSVLSFGQQQTGTSAAAQSISVENTGGAALTLTSTTVTGPFQILSNGCGSSLAASTACSISINFSPTATGAASGTLTLVDSAGTQTAPLTGTGIAPPSDTLSATSLTFPGTVMQQSSAPLTVTLTNSGGAPLTSIGTSVSGPFAASSTCGSSLAAGSSCVLSVIFSPTALGTAHGSVTVSDALRSQSIALVGTGLAPPVIALSSASLNFGSIQVNTSDSPFRVILTNTGGSPLLNATPTLSGAGAASYQVTTFPCTPTVAAGAGCSFNLIFNPKSTGVQNATLTIASTAPGVTPASIALTGIGLAPPSMLPSPATLNFGLLKVTFSSGPYNVTITNSGQEPLNPPTFALSGPNAADFVFVQSSCQLNGNRVLPGQSCTYQGTFNASIVGLESATLTFTSSNAIPASASIGLLGTGTSLIDFTTAPSSVTFPATFVGTPSSPTIVVLSELTKQPLNQFALAVNGPFQLIPGSTTCGTTLLGAGSCNAAIVYTPTAVGGQAGSLTVTSITPGFTPVTIPLSGSGLAVGELTLSAPTLGFGSVLVGSTSGAQQMTVTNSGAAPLNGLNVAATGPFTLAGNGCGSSLAPLSLCTVTVAYAPTTAGNSTGSLSVTSTSIGVAPIQATLTGNGLAPGALEVSPSFLAFGTQTIGQSSLAQPVTVFNTGPTALNLQPVTATGDFSLSTSTCGSQIAAGDNCTLYALFTPTQPGSRQGTLTLTATQNGIPVTVALSGTALAAASLAANTGALAFPSVGVGSTSNPLPLVLSNSGTAPVTGLTLSAAPPFSVQTGTCALQLAAGASCTAQVYFSPISTGSLTGSLTVASSTLGVGTLAIMLTGSGLPGGSITLTPNPLNFPSTTVGATSASQTIVVANPGASPVNGLTLAASGDFALASTSCPSQLIAQGSCTVQLVFKPAVVGGRQGELTASTTTAGVAQGVALLTGTGLAPAQLAVTPATLTFPATLLQQTSAAQTATVTNTGQSAISDLSLSTSGAFRIATTTCTAALASGAGCTVAVAFAPTVGSSGQTLTGALAISAPAESALGTAPTTVALSGTVNVPPTLAASPQLVVSFPVTSVGLAAQTQTVTVSNAGTSGALTGVYPTLPQSAQALGYFLASGDCGSPTAPITLAAGATCAVQVGFTPTASGVLNGSLMLTSSNGGGPLNLTLTGTGFDFTLTGQTTTASVVQGQTANFTLTLQALGATSGSFTLTCPNAPAGTLCLFNPSAPTALPVGTQAQFALAISTAAPVAGTPGARTGARADGNQQAAAGPSGSSLLPGSSSLPGSASLFRGGLALVALLLPWWPGRRRLRMLAALLVVCFAGVTLSLAGCAGASGSSSQLRSAGNAAQGTYSVQVTATTMGISHTFDVTLIVN